MKGRRTRRGFKRVTFINQVNEDSFVSKYHNWESEGLTNKGIRDELGFAMSFSTRRIAAGTVNPHIIICYFD